MGTPITDPLEDALPAPFQKRTIYAQDSATTTVRLMHDPAVAVPRLWFQPGTSSSRGTEAQYLVNGVQTFASMLEAIRTATGPDHFIYIAGWQFQLNLPLSAGDATTTMDALLSKAAAPPPQGLGVQVRALLWRNSVTAKNKKPGLLLPQEVNNQVDDSTLPGNMDEVAKLNAMPGDIAAIMDARLPLAGSHHQKIIVVSGGQGLIAFCGGIDIAADRVTQLYDVHCRLRGHGAHDLKNVFVERWQDHPGRTELEARPGKRKLLALNPMSSTTEGRQSIQVARTYAAGTFGFTKSGKIDVWLQLKHAIQTARKFIYMENQYFVSEDLAKLLASVLPNLEHLTVFLQCHSDMPEGYQRTKKCIDLLKAAPGSASKLRVFALTPGRPRNYIHTKTWIFDDETAIIGSANGTRRSFTCDSEANVQVFDQGREDQPSWRFARRLRVRLWAELLGMDTPEGHAELADGVASVVHWDLPPRPGNLVTLYEPQIEQFKRTLPDDHHFKVLGTFAGVIDKWDEGLDPFKDVIKP